MKFKRIAVSVFAAQVGAILADHDKAPPFIKDANATGSVRYGSDFILAKTDKGEVMAVPSDWIVMGPATLRVVANDDFKSEYVQEKDSPSTATAAPKKKPAKKAAAKKEPMKKAAKKTAKAKGRR